MSYNYIMNADAQEDRQILEEYEHHVTELTESMLKHDRIIIEKFSKTIDDMISERIDILRKAGVPKPMSFYNDISNVLLDNFNKSFEEYFEIKGAV